MPQTVSSVEASKAFGRISRQALVAPLTITHHGHDSLVLMSAAEYQRLKRRDREVFTLTDVPEEIVEGVRAARAPAEAAAFDHEVESCRVQIPDPVPGLVIRYSYLWSHEAKAGHEEGSKDRPCAVLLATTNKAGAKMVTILPVTHTPPSDTSLAVEIPHATKVRLGLDDDRSWVVLTELNYFQWPGPDLRTVPGDPLGEVAYGQLPTAFYETIRTRWLAAYDAGKVTQVKRTS